MLQIPRSQASHATLFEHLDFRAFLRERYEALHKENRSFSYRYIGGKAGLDSGTVSRVLNQDRKIDTETAEKFAKVFGLADRERDYFETLVLYCQAKSNTEKNHFLEKLLKHRAVRIKTLEANQFRFYKDWYNLAIWTLLQYYPYDGDPKSLARMLTPPITPQQAEESIAMLKSIGLVAEKDGRLQATEKLISSGDAIQAAFVNNLHLEMAKLAFRFLDLFGTGERDYSGLTLTLSPASFKKIKGKLKQYRQELMDIASQDADPDRVYRMNLQLFPLTRQYLKGEA